MRSLLILAFALGLIIAGGTVLGGPSGKAAAQSTGKEFAHGISKLERQIIGDYLHRHRGSLPPVFANAEPLPSEIAGTLAKARPLPAGIVGHRLPDDLIDLLPPRPGYEWLVVGTDIVLTNAGTGHIVGILSGALLDRA